MLGNYPRLKGGVEQRGGDTAKHTANEEDVVVVVVLGVAANDVGDTIGQRCQSSSTVVVVVMRIDVLDVDLLITTRVLFVSHCADDGAKDHGGPKACDKELPNGATVKAIVAVQGVDIRTLQPVARCGGCNLLQV